jgi:hypothetical protein
MPKAQ